MNPGHAFARSDGIRCAAAQRAVMQLEDCDDMSVVIPCGAAWITPFLEIIARTDEKTF